MSKAQANNDTESRREADNTSKLIKCKLESSNSDGLSAYVELRQNDKMAPSPSQAANASGPAKTARHANKRPARVTSHRAAVKSDLTNLVGHESGVSRSADQLSASSCSSLSAAQSASSLSGEPSSWSAWSFHCSLSHPADPPASEPPKCTNINNEKLLRRSALSWPSLLPSKVGRKVEWSMRRRAQICLMCRERARRPDACTQECALTRSSTCSTCSTWSRSTSFQSRPSCSWTGSSSASGEAPDNSRLSSSSSSASASGLSCPNSSPLSGAWIEPDRELIDEMTTFSRAGSAITRAPAPTATPEPGELARVRLAGSRRWLSSAALELSRVPLEAEVQSGAKQPETDDKDAASPRSTRRGVRLDYISGSTSSARKAADVGATCLAARDSASQVHHTRVAGDDSSQAPSAARELPKMPASSPTRLRVKLPQASHQGRRSGEQQRAAPSGQVKRSLKRNLKQSNIESSSDLFMVSRLSTGQERSVDPVHRNRLRSFYLHEFAASMDERRSAGVGQKSSAASKLDCGPAVSLEPGATSRSANSLGLVELQPSKVGQGEQQDEEEDDDDELGMDELAKNLAKYALRTGCVHCRCRHQLLMLVRSERILNRLAQRIQQGSISISEQPGRPVTDQQARSIMRVSSLGQVTESTVSGQLRSSPPAHIAKQRHDDQRNSDGESELNGSLDGVELASGDELDDDDAEDADEECEPDEDELDEEEDEEDDAAADDDELADDTEPVDGDSSSSSSLSSSLSARWSTCSVQTASSAVQQRQRRLALSAASAASRRAALVERSGASLAMSEEFADDDDESAVSGEPATPVPTGGAGVGVTLFRKWNHANELSSGQQRAHQFYRQQLNNPNLIQRRHYRPRPSRGQHDPSADVGPAVGRSLSANADQLERQSGAELADWWVRVQAQTNPLAHQQLQAKLASQR